MKGCFACLIVVGLVYGIPRAWAEEDESDLFVPAWEIPADALQPQNVRRKPSHNSNSGHSVGGTADQTNDAAESPESKTAGAPAWIASTRGSNPSLNGKETILGHRFYSLWGGEAPWKDDTKAFSQQSAAVVNGGRILNGEILNHCYGWLLGENADIEERGGPQSEYNQMREARVKEVLPFFIRRRLFADALEAQMTPQQLMKLHVDIGGMLKAEIKKQKRELKVATDEELERELNVRGTSLRFFESAFVAGHLERAFYERVIPEGRPISKQDLLDYYQSHLSDHTVPAKVKWDQIQISFTDEAAKRVARDRILSALEELKSGTPFADVAQKYSDASTARPGGKSAWLNAGSLRDRQLEQMLFEMPIGEWSNIHEGPNCWQLVRVLDRRSARVLPFSNVEEKIRANLEENAKENRAEEMFHTMLEEAEIKTEYHLKGLLSAESAADRPADASNPERGPWLDKEVFLKLNADWKPADATARQDQMMFPATVTDVDGEWLNLGRIWVRASDVLKLSAALDYFTDQIHLHPAEAACWAGRAAVWGRKGYVDAALADYATAIRLDPNQAMVHCFRAEMSCVRGMFGSASKDLAEAIRKDPECARAFYLRGGISNARGDHDAAISDLTQSIRLDPNFAMTYFARGVELQKHKRDRDAAIQDYTDAIRLDPRMVTAYINRGRGFDDSGDFAAAISDYSEAIRLDPKSAEACNNRGNALRRKGDIEAAINDLTEAIRLNPNLSEPYANRGLARWHSDINGAVSDFTEAIRLDPDQALVYFYRGVCLRQQGNFDDAIRDLTQAIQLDPNLERAYMYRGFAWRHSQDYDAAIKDFTEAIRIKPESAQYYFYRGSAWSGKGDFSAATKDMTEAIQLNPKMAVAYNGLAWQFATCREKRSRDGKRAVELATKACELSHWKEWGYIDTLAAAHAEAADFENAIKRQEQAIELAGDNADKRDAQARLELYRAHKPYRQVLDGTKTTVPDPAKPTGNTDESSK